MQSIRGYFQQFFHCFNTREIYVFKCILPRKYILSSFYEKIGPRFTYNSIELRNNILLINFQDIRS